MKKLIRNSSRETSSSSPRPKKSLGQNFLTSIPARNAIVKAGELTKGETVLEIGPGKGMLTVGLLEAGARVLALEKDRDLIPYLKNIFKDSTSFSLTEGDALTFTPPETPYKLIANIPYYITGAILSYYLTQKNQPSRMVVLVQKEVAERVVAKDQKGKITHSLLSLSVHVYGTPSIAYRVSKGSFNPIPKVDSAVLVIKDISRTRFKNQKHEDTFFKLIHAGFAHKRKFLIRNVETLLTKEQAHAFFERLHLSPKARAENVTLDEWLTLSYIISSELVIS